MDVTARFAEMVAESLRGERPAGQLRGMMSEQCLAPLIEAQRRGGLFAARCVRIRCSMPRSDAVEAVACYTWHGNDNHQARHTMAVAFRLSRTDLVWRCVRLEIIQPGVITTHENQDQAMFGLRP
ncbi:Rv3235 family protein [Propionibacterium sp.]|uniref:Rv3235 family protein n=1 Tax=Propionibacterium sp. TaxID=1977903 RepID=UPI0039ED8B9C